jgi:hypothetical protein
MKNSKILEMLNQNRIEELKKALQDEIFTESLKGKPDAKKRYSAMKKYLSYTDSAREILKKPCDIEIEGTKYTSFCNGYSLALSRETCGEIELCDDPDHYPPVTNLLRYDGKEEAIDIVRVLAEAKSKGYKLNKNSMYSNDYLMRYDGAYFRIGLLDMTYSIVNDGKEAIVYHVTGARKPLTITTDIGVCVVMPVFIDGDPEEETIVINTH